MSEYSPVSLPKELFERIQPFVEAARSNNRQFVMECVESICAMIQQTRGNRTVPPMVHRIAAALESVTSPEVAAEVQRREELEKHGVKFPAEDESDARKILKNSRKKKRDGRA